MSTDFIQLADREPFVTKQDLARHFGFTTKWVERCAHQGMPVHRFGPQGGSCYRVRYRLSEVEAWLADTGYMDAA